jgi:hypothetical protein
MTKGIFGSMFDFNRDGEMNVFERAAEFAFLSDLLSEEEKLEVETAHERLYDAIAAYNEQAVVVNKGHVEATEFALTVFSGAFALLPALLWFVKKRFMI